MNVLEPTVILECKEGGGCVDCSRGYDWVNER